MVLPYILFIFGEMSLVGLLANVLVIPFIPLAMLLALVAGLVGMWLPAIAGWFAWPASWLLTYMLDIANLLSRVPNAFVENVGFPLAHLIVSYAALCFICFVLWKKTKEDVTVTEKSQE